MGQSPNRSLRAAIESARSTTPRVHALRAHKKEALGITPTPLWTSALYLRINRLSRLFLRSECGWLRQH